MDIRLLVPPYHKLPFYVPKLRTLLNLMLCVRMEFYPNREYFDVIRSFFLKRIMMNNLIMNGNDSKSIEMPTI